MKRVFMAKYDSSGKFPDGRTRLDIYLYSSDGEKYVWTPDWKKENIRHFFNEAYQVEKLVSPERTKVAQSTPAMAVTIEKVEKDEEVEPVDFETLAFRLAHMLKRHISYEEIDRLAKIVFDFKLVLYPNPDIININSQTIYDWIMTLGKQPISAEAKLRLLRKFVASLAPPNTPLARIKC